MTIWSLSLILHVLQLINGIYKYNDENFQKWHRLVRNIPSFSTLSPKCVRDICLQFKFVKYKGDDTIVQFGQFDANTYFIEKGSVDVYVCNETTNCAYLIQSIKEGGSFNFSNSYLEQSSLFTLKTASDWILVKLNREDIVTVSKDHLELQNALETFKARLM